MTLIECIRDSWGWTGLEPSEVIDANAFGNLLVRDGSHRVWCIRPDLLSCELVAEDDEVYRQLRADSAFAADWEMAPLVALARRTVGPLASGRSYCLKIPAAIGGPYNAGNLASISTLELVGFAGDVASQIRDLPDGTRVQIKFVD